MEQAEISLYYRVFLSDMVSETRLYFFNGIAYNGGGDRSEFETEFLYVTDCFF